jgi:hypothetical protein
MRHGVRAEIHDVLWLALTWLALIALWGASDHWHVGDLRRRLTHVRQRPPVATRPFDQAG